MHYEMKEGEVRGGGVIWTCSRTDPGVRDRNEDACGTFTLPHREGALYLLAVADGLGGHPAGEVASAIAISALRSAVSSTVEALEGMDVSSLQAILATGFSHANREVIRYAATTPCCLGMGTTLVAALMNGEGAGVVGNVGDSRAYLFGEGTVRITRDHSRVQEMVDQGLISQEQAGNHPLRHIVTRIIGRTDDIPDFFPFRLKDDLLVLCSDGLVDGVSEGELQSLAGRHGSPDICERLVEYARGRSRDNITIVAAGRRRGLAFHGDCILA